MADHEYIDILFDGPPSHESGRFIESESPAGTGINAGEWMEDPIDPGRGWWRLRIKPEVFGQADPVAVGIWCEACQMFESEDCLDGEACMGCGCPRDEHVGVQVVLV